MELLRRFVPDGARVFFVDWGNRVPPAQYGDGLVRIRCTMPCKQMVFPVAIDRFCTGGRFRSSQQRADSLTVTSLLVRFSFSLSSVDVKGRPDAMVDVDKQTPCIVLDFKLVRPAACRFPVSFYVTV